VPHRADASRVSPLELEERGELVEGAADGLFVHAGRNVIPFADRFQPRGIPAILTG